MSRAKLNWENKTKNIEEYEIETDRTRQKNTHIYRQFKFLN